MSEVIIPDVEQASDVTEVDGVSAVNYYEKNLAELVRLFEELVADENRMKLSKEAETIKAAFYKRLAKDKAEAGLNSVDVIPDEMPEEEASEVPEQTEDAQETPADNPFADIERGFKEIYNIYRKERAAYNRQLEKEREQNLVLKEGVIEDLKQLLEKQDDVNDTFPAFRDIQNRWRAVGPVPAQNYRNINETYQLYVEQFYDRVKINRELRDLDFKKNLEVKEEFCALAERLAENENVLEAFNELQKLHEQWKEYGPVAKEFREQIWDRFKAATSVINRKYQAYFEGVKAQQTENLVKKTALCEKVEEIAAREVADSNEWNSFSKEIEDIQKEWKTIGFASRKENQKIYDRFRAACNSFYERKREFYTQYKDNINSNLEKKTALCEEAERLKSSTDWKKTADQFIALQKQWKEIGAVPRKKSEQLWKRFRAACDEFFAERDKQAKPENDFYGNLKAKQRLVEEINSYALKGDESDSVAQADFQKRWQEIGFVPFKEKDKIAQLFKEAMAKFPSASRNARRENRRGTRPQLSEKERLIQKYHALEQDIITYENNMGFFSMSKNSEPLIRQMQEKIDRSKEELKAIAVRIKELKESGQE